MSEKPVFQMPLDESMRTRLTTLHGSLLRLHKVLLDYERAAYEKEHGPIPSTAQVLNLVMSDRWFDWLHRISEIIVQIDEVTESDEATLEMGSDLFETARELFRVTDVPTDFMKRYKHVLQKDPGAVLAHVDVQRALTEEVQ